jgi:hypothetical protein
MSLEVEPPASTASLDWGASSEENHTWQQWLAGIQSSGCCLALAT